MNNNPIDSLDIISRRICEDAIKSILEIVMPEPEKLVEMVCYQALCKIRNILNDDTLDDPECFMRIVDIVDVLEDIGSSGGSRHDFG